MTWDPARVSRDSERWCALGTYGHPSLTEALEKLVTNDGDDALVIQEVGRVAAAYRADRTPPERIQTVRDLEDMSAPVTMGDAQALAQQTAEEAAAELDARMRAVEQGRELEWQRGVIRRFRQLVARAINAEGVLRLRRDGEAVEPLLLWHELRSDEMTGWSQADIFRQHLGLDVTDLLPGPPGADDRANRVLTAVRGITGAELLDLMREWVAVAHPEYTARA